MKIATWNVNSLKVRLPQVLDWLSANAPDVLCLQELKQEDKDFPSAELASAGYRSAFSGQKTYNGVAILTRGVARDIECGIPGFEDIQRRLITATVDSPLGALRIVCAYIPNGQSTDSDKYQYKLRWLAALTGWLRKELEQYPRLALLGDYNIAPDDRDVHDPAAWLAKVLCSDPERAAFRGFLDLVCSQLDFKGTPFSIRQFNDSINFPTRIIPIVK